jgi:L-lactate dehydrogenase complex protein LldF
MTTAAAKFKKDVQRVTADLRHRRIINTALDGYAVKRDQKKSLFQDWAGARRLAAATKYEAINGLDRCLEQFARGLEARGAKVHWASTGQQACEIIVSILKQRNARSVVKSKAMTAEEIHLNAALERAGLDVVETDLGEFIVQLRDEPPYHIVFPAMHLTRDEIQETFRKRLGDAPSDNPEELTMVARRVLRQKYIQADAGITGANFAVADVGLISLTENEGNARLTGALPRTMITLGGIEKVIPRLEDLALFLPMLATVGAGQLISGYNTLYGGPRQPGRCRIR